MNPDPARLLTKLQSRLTIRQAQQTITTEKESMKIYCFTPAEREIIKANKGSMTKVIEARKASAEARKALSEARTSAPPVAAKKTAPASSATKPAPATSKPVTTAPAPKDNGLAISHAEFDALPPSDKMEFKRLGGQVATASSATAPELAGLTGLARATAIHKAQAASVAPVAAKPATAPTAPKSTAPALTGLARATAVHQGKAVQPSTPPALTGLARATALHKAESDARKK